MTLRILVTCALLGLSIPANATTLRPLQAVELVDQAELIVVGTAVDRRVATTLDGSYPYTFITFEIQQTLKGETESKRLTLRFEGGELGDEYILVQGMPEFERGGEYLLFVADNGTATSPVVGWQLGVFELVTHPTFPTEKVMLDRMGMAVEGVGQGSFLRSPVVREGLSVKRAAPTSGVTVIKEEGVKIIDPLRSAADRPQAELIPASKVLHRLRSLVSERSATKGFRPGTRVPSLTLDDVPEGFSLRAVPAPRR